MTKAVNVPFLSKSGYKASYFVLISRLGMFRVKLFLEFRELVGPLNGLT